MILSIKESLKVDITNVKDLEHLESLMMSIEEGLEYLVFTDYYGGDHLCSVAYATSEALEGPSVLIDDSIKYVVIKIADGQTLDNVFEYLGSLVDEEKIKRAYLIDYIRKNENGLEFFISVE